MTLYEQDDERSGVEGGRGGSRLEIVTEDEGSRGLVRHTFHLIEGKEGKGIPFVSFN